MCMREKTRCDVVPPVRWSLCEVACGDATVRRGGGRKTEAWETVPVELAAAKEFHEVAGLAPLDLLMTLDLAHKRGRVCVRDEIFTSHSRCGNGGAYLLKGQVRDCAELRGTSQDLTGCCTITGI